MSAWLRRSPPSQASRGNRVTLPVVELPFFFFLGMLEKRLYGVNRGYVGLYEGLGFRVNPLGRPLGYLIFSLMALIGDHIY